MQKSLTTMHLVNFYRWFQSTTLSDHLSFFCLLGNEVLKSIFFIILSKKASREFKIFFLFSQKDI
jgi:hypothetical protein